MGPLRGFAVCDEFVKRSFAALFWPTIAFASWFRESFKP